MEYSLNQTYNDNDAPTTYLKGETIIYNNVTFDSNYRWRVKSTYLIDIWRRACTSHYPPYAAVFEYIFPNVTRQIQIVLQSHGGWPLIDKHPSIYSGVNPDNKEYFFLDEMMLLIGEDGMLDEIFDKIGTGDITLDGKVYDTNIFELNKSFPIYSG